MGGREGNVSEDALSNMAYLARSTNRIEILETLATGPHATREIEAATGASRSTVERISSELEQRDWAERTNDGTYALTGVGEHVATETGRYVGALQAIARLGEAVTWLPTDELTTGLHRFSEATVRRPESHDVAAADTRIISLMQRSDVFACLSNTAGTIGLETRMMEEFVEGRLDVENVMTPAELDIYLDDPERASRWQEYVEAGAKVYCYRGRIPCNLILVDDAVFLGDRQLETVGVIESADDAVREWAGSVLDSYRNDAERLDPSAFSPEASSVRETHL
jgi:predicted transcriptional regulator